MTQPPIIHGRRRPKRDFDRSASMPESVSEKTLNLITVPMSGCMIKPESGPATNTSDIKDFDRPSSSRYGEAGGLAKLNCLE